MATLKEQKEQALKNAGIGIANRNIEQANKGVDDFIRISIMELDLERNMDEAERYDDIYDYNGCDYNCEECDMTDGCHIAIEQGIAK